MRNGFGRGDRSQNLPMPGGKVTMTGRAFTREQLLLTLLGVIEMARRHKRTMRKVVSKVSLVSCYSSLLLYGIQVVVACISVSVLKSMVHAFSRL